MPVESRQGQTPLEETRWAIIARSLEYDLMEGRSLVNLVLQSSQVTASLGMQPLRKGRHTGCNADQRRIVTTMQKGVE